ncbi:MAG: hypothetical protein H7123_01750 [Thermoleophilia bacterium]|nr:hypothetical protein [Thermoleophilia bacterium]
MTTIIAKSAALGVGALVLGSGLMTGALALDANRVDRHPPAPGTDASRPFAGISMIGLGIAGAALVLAGSAGGGDAKLLAAGAGLLTPMLAVSLLHIGDQSTALNRLRRF